VGAKVVELLGRNEKKKIRPFKKYGDSWPIVVCFCKKIMFQGNLPRRNIEQISINSVKSKDETSLQSG